MLCQTYGDLEIIVVDDGSTDGSIDTISDLVADPRVRLIRQANAGKSQALNAAIDVAGGEFLMIHDGDDVSVATRVAKLVSALHDRPELAGVLSRHALLVGTQVVAPRRRGAGVEECARCIGRFEQPAHDPTLLFRRDAVDDPVFDEDLRVGQGVDLVLRLGERCGLVVLGEPLYHYRVDPHSNTRRDPARTQHYSRQVILAAATRRGVAPPQGPIPHASPGWPAGDALNAVLDARLIDGRRASLRSLADIISVFGVRWSVWKALVYAFAPMRVIVRIRPDANSTSGPS